MAGRMRDTEVCLAPDHAVDTGYHHDFFSWLNEQASHVREGRWEAIDRDNLAEEIESLGREQFNKLESAFRVLLMHMLKWGHQPRKRSRTWALSISEQRLAIEDVLADNPGLKPRIGEAISRAYRRARLAAARETDLDQTVSPQTCPYSFKDIMSQPFDR